MVQEKSLKEILKALKSVKDMEERRGLNRAIVKQWGGPAQVAKILAKAPTKGRFLDNLRDIRNSKLGNLASYLFISQWETFGDREAVVDGDRRFTFTHLLDRVLRLANAFQDLGVEPRDRVGIMLFNCAEYFETLYAASLIGAPMPAVNWHLKGKELVQTVNLRKPRVLVFDHEFIEDIQEHRKEMNTVEHFVMVGGDAPKGFKSYDRLIDEYPNRMPKTNFILALNPYTGGTTGTPKSSNLYDGLSYLMSDVAEAPRAPLSDYVKYLIRQYSYLYYYGADKIEDPVHGNIRTLVPTPMYHAGTAAGFAPCLLFGATAVPMRRFNPEDYLRLVQDERINWSFIVPTILQRILELPDEVTRKYDLRSMNTLICAAAPCPPEVKRDTNKLFMRQGCDRPVFHEYYGSSETAIITILIPEDYEKKTERLHSVGKARCGDIMVYDEVAGKECGPGEDGRILCRSVSTMSLRYPGMEAKLDESLRIIDGVEWYDDGLIGHLDIDGYLFLTGRIKEMIICGGVNIYPKEIEEALFRYPKIVDCAVIRGPHPDLGEVPIACVQLREGEEAAEEDILEYLVAEGLRGYNIPRKVDFYEKLPRHIDGKLIKRELEKKYWEGVERRG